MPARHEVADALISEVRGQHIIIASDLAGIYGVETKALNQAVRRNRRRFPADFVFRLTRSEAVTLQRSRSQTVTSPRAIRMSVFVVRAFLRLREWASKQSQLAARLAQLENRVDGQDETIVEMMAGLRRTLH
jgi:hypothetical protein